MTPSQEHVAATAQRLLDSRDDLVATVVRTTREEIAALDHDATTRALLQASVAENVEAGLQFLRQGLDAEVLEAPTSALAYARTLAQRDVPVSALIRAYRIGERRVLDAAFPLIEDVDPALRVAVTVAVVRRTAEFIDRIVDQVGRTYELERDRWVAGRSGVRQQWVSDLLDGRAVDLREAEQALSYPLGGVHLACELWPADGVSALDLGPAVEATRQYLAAILHAHASLVVPTDDRELRLWFAVAPAATAASAPGTVTAPAGTLLHVALGRPGGGLPGFRSSVAEAARVKELLVTGREHGAAAVQDAAPLWVRFADVAPVALMAADRRGLVAFVGGTLGDLGGAGARAAMLRETLRVFLTARRSYAATAELMSLHRNSVQYRVQQALLLLPVEARGLSDDFDVRAALLAAHWLGGAVTAASW